MEYPAGFPKRLGPAVDAEILKARHKFEEMLSAIGI
jgi:hypothetical protein